MRLWLLVHWIGLILWLGISPVIAGGGLLAGSLLILVEAACREARRRRM